MKPLTERQYLPRLRITSVSDKPHYHYERRLHGKWIPCNQGRAIAMAQLFNRRGLKWRNH